MPKGSVLLYLGSLYHGGGANNSSQPRRGINVGYTLSWLRQEENQYLACPPEDAREFPEDLARLAGFLRYTCVEDRVCDRPMPATACFARAPYRTPGPSTAFPFHFNLACFC